MPGPVFPSDAPRPAKSQAEKQVWERLKKQLPKGWTAWHSLKIRVKSGYLGETDFVLAHPDRGMLVLEVKGGAIEQRDGRWFSNGTALEAAPLDQARDYLRKLVSRLAEESCQPPAFGATAAFPDTDFDVQPTQDDLRGVVLGHSQLTWLGEALPAVVERALLAPRPGVGDWMKVLHRLWGQTWVPTLSLGTRIDLQRDQRLQLDEVQLAILDGLAEQDRVLVQGGAGSGKTLVAAEAARREAAGGKRVLLLCFTQPLKKWLQARLDGSGVEVETVSGLAKQLAEAVDGPWHGENLTETEVWRRYYERAADVGEAPWDAVIVDEAQDLMFEAWYFVKAISEGKRLWAFHDPGQGYWKDRSPPSDLFGKPFKLGRGKRSPAGVEALARRYLGEAVDETAIARALKDRTLGLVPCPEPTGTALAVGAEIDRLLKDGVALQDIGVVSLRGQTAKDAVHHAAALGRHGYVHADADDMADRLVADSFLRWKGLERPVILVADVAPGLGEFGTRIHIALTRALTAARVIAPPAPSGAWPGLPAP
jgi:hypothetical protein